MSTLSPTRTADNGDAMAIALLGRGIDQAVTANPVVTGTFTVNEGFGYNTAAASGTQMRRSPTTARSISALIANATAYHTANAFAGMATGIHQSANAGSATIGTGATVTQVGGDATAYMTNAAAGTINIGAVAHANGGAGGGDAHAFAGFFNGIVQDANADAGDANATMINAGAINIVATATAHALDQVVVRPGGFSSTHVTTPTAGASAVFGHGISQSANASGNTEGYASVGAPGPYGTVTTTFTYNGSANAAASLANSGLINIAADATASAAHAHAVAGIGTGIHQGANATGGTAATANVSLTNTAYGTIAVGAVARPTVR